MALGSPMSDSARELLFKRCEDTRGEHERDDPEPVEGSVFLGTELSEGKYLEDIRADPTEDQRDAKHWSPRWQRADHGRGRSAFQHDFGVALVVNSMFIITIISIHPMVMAQTRVVLWHRVCAIMNTFAH